MFYILCNKEYTILINTPSSFYNYIKKYILKDIYKMNTKVFSLFISNLFYNQYIFEDYYTDMLYQKYSSISSEPFKFIELLHKYKKINYIKTKIKTLFTQNQFSSIPPIYFFNSTFLFGFIYCNVNKKTYFNTFVYPQICGT